MAESNEKIKFKNIIFKTNDNLTIVCPVELNKNCLNNCNLIKSIINSHYELQNDFLFSVPFDKKTILLFLNFLKIDDTNIYEKNELNKKNKSYGFNVFGGNDTYNHYEPLELFFPKKLWDMIQTLDINEIIEVSKLGSYLDYPTLMELSCKQLSIFLEDLSRKSLLKTTSLFKYFKQNYIEESEDGSFKNSSEENAENNEDDDSFILLT